jgi:2'-5' RNA ligase
VTLDRLHVTLRLVGNYAGLPASVVEAAKLAGDAVAMTPFDIALSHTASFGGGAVVLRGGEGSEALIALGNAIGVAMMKAGLKSPSAQSRTPHMTLLYDRASSVAEEPVEPLRWTAREFVLVHSRVGLTDHKALARWPLLSNS